MCDFVRPASPATSFLMSAGSLILFANIVTWAGRALGGQGGLEDMIKLIVWLQLVGLVLQSVGLTLMLILPLVAGLYWLFTVAISIWLVLAFIRAGHRFDGFGPAFAVLVISVVGIVFGLVLVTALVGAGAGG